MKQEIIDKLNLKVSDVIIGESKRNNIIIYELDENILLANCENDGTVSELSMVVIRVFLREPKITFRAADYILLNNIDQFYAQVKRTIEVYEKMTYK